jgi:multidrug efflux pump subunit AcrA (membrane-fusion protein)
MAIPKDDRT